MLVSKIENAVEWQCNYHPKCRHQSLLENKNGKFVANYEENFVRCFAVLCAVSELILPAS